MCEVTEYSDLVHGICMSMEKYCFIHAQLYKLEN